MRKIYLLAGLALSTSFALKANTISTNEINATQTWMTLNAPNFGNPIFGGLDFANVNTHENNFAFTLNGNEEGYCEPELDCTDGDLITNVTFAGINNTTTCSPNGYGNYTNLIANVEANGVYPISVKVGDGYIYESVTVWIDFNNNGIFEESEYTYIGTASNVVITNNIIIPDVAPGDYRMRVRVAAANYGAVDGTLACDEDQLYGETEDYTVRVTENTGGGENPCLISSFPFVETFEDDSATKNCWTNSYVNGSANWTIGTGDGTTAATFNNAYEGTKNARYVSSSTFSVTKFVSPTFDLSNASSANLSFYYGQDAWGSDQNTLTVYYRLSPSSPWEVLETFEDEIEDWTLAEIEIPETSATLQIAFEGLNHWGRPNVLDNIVVDAIIDEEPEPSNDGCFNTGSIDQWPSNTYTPSCIGAAETITSAGWAGEYSKVTVTAGTTYTFSSSVATDFITIAKENEDVTYITGTGSVTWTAAANEVIRFYTHKDSDCTTESLSRSRLVLCGEVVPPPANDECSGAIALNCGDTHTGNTMFATDSGANVAADVFYTYTGNGEAQMVTVSLCNSSYDTYLRVFTDCSLATEIAQNDDACGNRSELQFLSDGTSTYYIMVEGYGSNAGAYQIDLTCSAPPAFTCEENFVASNGFEDGLFFGGDTNQRLAVDVIVGEQGFTVEGVKLNVFVDGSTDLDFHVKFYENNGGLPGNEILSTNATIHESSVAGSAFGYDIYTYVIDLEESIALNANTTYWMEVQSSGMAWEAAYTGILGAGGAFMNTNTGDWMLDSTMDQVYELVCEELGISDLAAFDFSYYPNPVNDVLNISAKQAVKNVSVFNLAGQEVVSKAKVNNGQINVASLAAGTYVFRVTLENGQVETFKIVKK